MPTTPCPRCGATTNKYAFGPSKNYLGCPNGHVYPNPERKN